MTQLEPTAEAVADLLVRMCREPWPTTEQDRRDYFATLGLTDQELLPVRDDDADSTWRRFTTALPEQVGGNCSTFRGEFLGLSLFCWPDQVDNGAQARTGYATLQELLNQEFGASVEEWGTDNEPACLWTVGPLTLEMYCFQRLHSSVMVGPSHTTRSAANDAAHQDHPDNRP